MYKAFGTVLAFLTVLGMPLFAVMGGISILSWLSSDNPEYRFVRFLAANVLEDRFASSPILVTIPLFTFAGYLMAESKTPDRIVRASGAALGWMPGGLAVVCIFASAFFTTMTGGSGVTIVAIGGLLYPALLKQGYPQKFSLGLITTAGAVGLLFFPSPLVMIYAFIAKVDVNKAYIATFPPGVFLMGMLCLYAMYVGNKTKVARAPFSFGEMFRAIWSVKWEACAPLLVGLGLGTGLMGLDESAAAAAFYILIVEVYIYKDLSWKKVVKVAKDAMTLSGAIILILAMATAMTNYIIQERIPQSILEWFVDIGMSEPWHFILVLNLFLFILGMLMDAFSALLVALPLLIPLAARFGIHPFHLAVMFLLNLEIAYVTPPVGLNLYIASFRFNKPVFEVYKVVLPFVALLAVGLGVVLVVPSFSSFTVNDDIALLRAQAEKAQVPPRESWMLECVQEDSNNPLPCSDEDKVRFGKDGTINPYLTPDDAPAEVEDAPDETGGDDMDDLMKLMMGEGAGDGGAPSGDPDEELMKQMMGETAAPDGGAKAAPVDPDEALLKEMMGEP